MTVGLPECCPFWSLPQESWAGQEDANEKDKHIQVVDLEVVW